MSLQTVEVIKADADQLAEGVQSTSELSERVSQKIRQLDTAQSRVHSTLGRIGVIVDRSNAVDGVRSALEAEDFEKAANCLKAYFELEEQQQTSHKDALESQQAEDQRRVSQLNSMISMLKQEMFLAYNDPESSAK